MRTHLAKLCVEERSEHDCLFTAAKRRYQGGGKAVLGQAAGGSDVGLAFPGQGEAVADGDKADRDAVVRGDFLVEGA